jgi:hypothetical protein
MGLDICCPGIDLFHTFQFLPDFQRTLYQPVQEKITVSETTDIYRTGQLHLPSELSGLLELDPGDDCIYDWDVHTDGDIQPDFCPVYRYKKTIPEVFSDGLLFTCGAVVGSSSSDMVDHI